jgi:hypothetical protein
MNTEMRDEPLLELEGSILDDQSTSNDRGQDSNPPNSPSSIFEMESIFENTVFGNSNAVCLKVNTKSIDRCTIPLDIDEDEACHISGSPFSMPRLITAQGLDAPFGRLDHRRRKRSDNSEALARKKR